MNTITLDGALSWVCCYSRQRLTALYAEPRTLRNVLTLRTGAWADVPDADRVYTVVRHCGLDDITLRLFSCRCARRALARQTAAGRAVDPRSTRAVDIAEAYCRGEATAEELDAARSAALSAAHSADAVSAYAAAAAAAYAAAAAAAAAASAWYAAYSAALSRAAAAVSAADSSAASADERAAQVADLLELIEESR